MRITLLLLLLLVSNACASGEDFEIGGGIQHAGKYPLQPTDGVIALVVRAGGFSIEGCAIVSISRKDPSGHTTTIRRNIWETLAEFKAEPPLEPGDQVFVPQHNFPCMDHEQVNALIRDYLRLRAQCPTPPANWAKRVQSTAGGTAKLSYENGKRSVDQSSPK